MLGTAGDPGLRCRHLQACSKIGGGSGMAQYVTQLHTGRRQRLHSAGHRPAEAKACTAGLDALCACVGR
eukprot:1329910-Rhodomonas_salina.3